MPGKHASPVERFWRHVKKSDGCWEWMASRLTSGYGQFKPQAGASPERAHRYSWLLHFGPIPDGLWVCHHCDNPPCVRPEHLFLGTHLHNVRDMIRKGRAASSVPDNVVRFVGTVRRLSDEEIVEARSRHAAGESCRSIARRLGCHHTTIVRLVRGEHWQSDRAWTPSLARSGAWSWKQGAAE